ncbi:hypothetical protein [Nostoc commune]|nr:hypothetical protein [Nostoc commune]
MPNFFQREWGEWHWWVRFLPLQEFIFCDRNIPLFNHSFTMY